MLKFKILHEDKFKEEFKYLYSSLKKSMKVYPSDALERFEFDQILADLKNGCHSDLGKELAERTKPYAIRRTLETSLAQCVELLEIEVNDLAFPEINFPGLKEEIKWLAIEGSRLEGRSLLKIVQVARVIKRLYSFLKEIRKEYPALFKIVEKIEDPKDLIKMIDAKIDSKGGVRSNASKELFEIRSSLDSERIRSKKKFESLLKKYRKLGWLREFDESYYNNRRVLAAESEYKRKIKGIIHGMSESGKSTFIEPMEMVEINNLVASLEQEELNEVNRILTQLTAEVAGFLPSIKAYHKALGLMDYTRAKVRLAIRMNALLPEISQDGEILLIEARHPVLEKHFKQEDKSVVPLNMHLDAENKIMVISGPNAGGKSIALKTLGLLQLMLQSGLLVPLKEGSKMRLFNKLFVDIGDDQSIEYELSTYSSRLVKMKYFLEFADKESILFIDEFGTGSDPDLGGALAEIMLQDLLANGSYGMITTHYNNIKVFAENNAGISNASMLFHKKSLKPLFTLEQGSPGSSFTFEVATKIGLKQDLIERAKTVVDDQKVNFDKVLIQLQARKNELNRKNRSLSKNQKLLSEELDRSKEDYALIEKKLAQLNDPENIRLYEQGRKYERILEQYQKSKNKKEILKRVIIASDKWASGKRKEEEKDALQKLKAKQARIKKNKKVRQKEKAKQKKWIPEIGDTIKIGNSKQSGEIISIEKNKAEVIFGTMKTFIDLEKVQVVKKANK